MKPLARPHPAALGFRRALIGASLVRRWGRLPAAFTPAWPLAADLRRAGAGRAVPQPAIHRAEHAGLRRYADRAAHRPPPASLARRSNWRRRWAWCWRRPRWSWRATSAGACRAAAVPTSRWPSWWRRWSSPPRRPSSRLAPDAGEAVSGMVSGWRRSRSRRPSCCEFGTRCAATASSERSSVGENTSRPAVESTMKSSPRSGRGPMRRIAEIGTGSSSPASG